jgi:DNA-binding CsgD family transcriptional regulator
MTIPWELAALCPLWSVEDHRVMEAQIVAEASEEGGAGSKAQIGLRDAASSVGISQPVILLARAQETAALEGVVQAARDGQSGVLVVRGEAGIGKTSLLDHMVTQASDLHLVSLAGIEAEMVMPYAALHRLLLPLMDGLDVLADPQREALTTAFGLHRGTPADRFLVALAALTLLSDVAARRPLLCIVDDVQWLDPESVEVFAFVGRRLRADGIALLLAVREPDPRSALLDGLPQIQIVGLPRPEALSLLEAAFGAEVDPGVSTRLFTETGGNPLALAELVRDLSPSELAGTSVLPADLPLSRRLEAAFLRQVHRLSDDNQLLLLVASAESSADPGVVLSALASLGVILDGKGAAETDDLLVLLPNVAFRHPLIRSAVYQGASLTDRRRIHAALAVALDQDRDPDRWAWHRAAASAGPDDKVADALERGATRARERGGSSAEAALLARSADLTADERSRSVRRLAAAEAALIAGEVQLAEQHLAGATGVESDLGIRVRGRRIDGQRLRQLGCLPESFDILIGTAELAGQFDPIQQRDALFEALEVLVTARLVAAGGVGDPVSHPESLIPPVMVHGVLQPRNLFLDSLATRFTVGHQQAAPILARLMVELKDDRIAAPEVARSGLLGFFAALEAWDDEAIENWMERVIQVARDAGALHALRIAMLTMATVQVLFGRFDGAKAFHDQHDGLASAIGGHQDFFRLHETELHAWQGLEVETRAGCDSMIAVHAASPDTGSLIYLAENALAVLDLGAGRYAAAAAHLRRIYDDDPPRYGGPTLPDMVEAASRGGDEPLAAAALNRLQNRALASGSPWALGVLARSLALCSIDSAAETHYRKAIEHLSATRVRTDLARAHLVYGEWLRRQKRRADSRVQLRIAHEMFQTMGADGFAERARAELEATGERARRRSVETADVLTPQEAHIARLAIGHATNREIGAQLFISARTVEYHLHHIFQKLQITSRRELIDAIPTEAGEPTRERSALRTI